MKNEIADYNKELLIALREKAELGSKTFQMLLTEFDSLEGIVDADFTALTDLPRIDDEKAEIIKGIDYRLKGIAEDLELFAESGINVITIFDEAYPELLKELSDPPFVLYTKGNFPLQAKIFIGMVGTTTTSADGLELMVDYARDLASKGAVIVSGLARGADSAAHLGSIKAEGCSYAVLGCGFNNIYPEENQRLSEELLEKGALISEYPPDTKVSTGKLISRNRLIVGLSHAVVVGEVDKKSRGTIDAAERTVESGKLLFAIGNKYSPVDTGLIEYGAIPLENLSKTDMILEHCI